MAEYIERKALREAFCNADADIVEEYGDGDCDWGFGLKNILEVINSVPAADVSQVRHGWWIEHDDGVSTCSECGKAESNECYFCRYCGAKMDGKQ